MTGRRFVLITASAAAIITSGACTTENGSSPATVRWDSAGIEIVETTGASHTSIANWTIDSEPELAIGLVEGQDPYLFSQINGAIRLDDGTIVVADGQSAELRFFNSSGEFLHASGGLGAGPEEFSHLAGLERCGTRIYALNLSPPRVTVWNHEGRLSRAFDFFEPGTNRSSYGTGRLTCSPGGEFVVTGWGESMSGRYRGQSVVFEDQAPVWVLDTIAHPIAELGVFPTTERVALVNPNGGGGISTPPLGRITVFAFGVGGVYIGTAEDLSVRQYDRAGSLLRILRVPDADLAAGDALQEIVASDPMGSDARVLSRMRALDLPVPTRLPAYSAMRLDAEGFLWVRRYGLPTDSTSRWGVFSPDGGYLGHVETPGGLEILDIGSAYILGVTKDELDVEQVRLHLLLRR